MNVVVLVNLRLRVWGFCRRALYSNPPALLLNAGLCLSLPGLRAPTQRGLSFATGLPCSWEQQQMHLCEWDRSPLGSQQLGGKKESLGCRVL